MEFIFSCPEGTLTLESSESGTTASLDEGVQERDCEEDGLWYFGKDRFQRPLPPEWVSSMGSIYKLLKIHLCLLIYAAEEAEIAGSLLLGVSTSQERA